MFKYINFLQKNKFVIILFFILLLASFLRLYRISEYMTFLGDEGRDLLEVRKILSGNLVFLGPRSSAADFYYGPIYFYLITPFLLLFNYDPVGPAIFIAILGIITVYLVYRIGKEFFGTLTGIIAASLYSVSPIVIAYSRSSWNPNPMPLVALLVLYLAYKAIKDNSMKLFLASGVLLGIAMQLQYLAVFLGIILFVFTFFGLFINVKTRKFTLVLKSISFEVLGFIIGWAPFLAFELKHSFPNLRTIYNFLIFGNPESIPSPNYGFFNNLYIVFLKLFDRLVTNFPTNDSSTISSDPMLRVWHFLTIALGIASILLIFKIKDRLVRLLFIMWSFGGILLFGFYRKDIYDYYLGFMFPLPFLLVSNTITTLFRSKDWKNIGKFVATLSFLILFIVNINANPFKFSPNRQKDQVKKIADFVLSKTDNQPYNFALLSDGNSDHAYRYFLELAGKPPIEIKNDVLDPKRDTVSNQLLIVCEKPKDFCHPLGSGKWEVAGFGRAQIVGEWPVSVVTVIKMTPFRE